MNQTQLLPDVEAIRILQEELGRRIRHARELRGMSQTALSSRSGLHVSHISKIERGGANVTLASLAALSTALKMNLFEFFQDILFALPDDSPQAAVGQPFSEPACTADAL